MLGQAPAAYYQVLPGPRETLLSSVGSDDTHTWGDASSVFFLLANAALNARDFSIESAGSAADFSIESAGSAADFSRAVCVADEC